MRHRWHTSVITAMLLAVMAMAVPSTGWPKGDRPAQPTKQESGVARGIVKAVSQAVLYAQIQGRVNQVPYKEGQRFVKGATLVQLECDKYQAELAVAAAEHEGKNKTFQNNKELAKLNAVSTLDLEVSEADAKKAGAARRIAEINVRGCHLAAPFAGRIVDVMVHEHENVFPNDKLLSVLDDTSLEIELVLPSMALSWLKRQARFTFIVDETGQGYQAKVKEIGASVDAASQTVKVTGVFDTLPKDVLSGMSGSAQFVE
ncbi:MAG: efflux RND transporter periplasmic adaptor subunit [Nitrospira sp.]|nr:efflux RND transporter periplasmic adaptor subunit [Nitrospira sp.]MDH4304471.1 efflux RND transporter periplasmic adaptor subunit [Nitrospira sp.]MDH5193974.1 efflux RND transporter periplasmic adaptor subunit [Nitrospira sp.]